MPRYIDADVLIDFLDVGHLRHPSELCFSEVDVANLLLHAPTISPDEVRGVGEWEDAGKQMVINLENAREQYSALGYPHRTELKRRCSLCRKITLVDASIEYRYCPHCGARMKGD